MIVSAEGVCAFWIPVSKAGSVMQSFFFKSLEMRLKN